MPASGSRPRGYRKAGITHLTTDSRDVGTKCAWGDLMPIRACQYPHLIQLSARRLEVLLVHVPHQLPDLGEYHVPIIHHHRAPLPGFRTRPGSREVAADEPALGSLSPPPLFLVCLCRSRCSHLLSFRFSSGLQALPNRPLKNFLVGPGPTSGLYHNRKLHTHNFS